MTEAHQNNKFSTERSTQIPNWDTRRTLAKFSIRHIEDKPPVQFKSRESMLTMMEHMDKMYEIINDDPDELSREPSYTKLEVPN